MASLYSTKRAKAPHTDETRHADLEIWPVLLQFGVVHVHCEELEVHTNKETSTHNQYNRGIMDFDVR